MIRESKNRESQQKGFTLLEVLVAITILGLMAGVVFGGLRLGIQAWEKGEKGADRLQRLRIISDLISSQLRDAYPYSLVKPLKSGQRLRLDRQEVLEIRKKGPPVFFQGRPKTVRFVSTRALDPSMNGLVQVFYELADDQIFRAREYYVRGMDSLQEVPDKDGNVLLTGVGSVRFDYLGTTPGEKEPTWRNKWDGRRMRGLPMGVRIRMEWIEEGISPLDWIVWIPSKPWIKSRRLRFPAVRPFLK
ncbi:MAG: prepilin-type N-terminal cleavage/methylation domain-containing protein [Deltaproteobacteria bacterium]|nr:prepilin-type N-terminal cleavage/methylation domain-containing protein [Deltaproteobacteria bacterium]MBW2307060.1 prepilin-type N-terminal cleavage/methylation domain-containing protein [Deltaproteobacteria bacterium]